ncbi:hypothetical protein Angca_004041 [Angiostrongylus cantonensis]|nr:hypothetical protein Angca_004041 [Angiostrongylus cantonensis]
MLRRSFWHSSVRLGIERFASSELVPVVIDTLKETYPELKRYEESIRNSVVEEERQYWSVVDKGKSIFEQMRMNMPDEATVFSVFTPLESRIIGVYANGERVHSLSSIGSIVLENCQFYAEEGGQKCDKGFLELDEKSVFEVVSVVKSKGISILSGNVINQNKISEGSMVRQKIDVGKNYPPVVRVARVGSRLEDAFAVECCSGTHVLNTSSILDFTILSDRSCAKGARQKR